MEAGRVTEEIVRLDPPEFDRVRAWVWLEPTVTFPKLTDPGETLRVPAAIGAVPVPDKAIATLGSEAFEARARVAVADPAALGANMTERFALWPAASMYGNVSPLTLKTEPVRVAEEIVRLDPPEFDTVSTCDWVAPV
jgi:hypothetical protein